ncbi:hypothetical protein SSX86_012236 [Deinandra increscens subsp. villosa]|uniref:Disease resistance N-terminal domain-containing protein n=1 Tax=Deinandra increscens subsp. villosa TaxID=3103831 RepID=A0AAP0D3U2_9ASTR
MAELVLSALLPPLFEKLASTALKKIPRYKEIDADINKWQRSLKQIQGVLNDASRKEITNDSVKQWLVDLHHLAYDIDDVLDDLANEAMHRDLTDEPETHISKVRKFFSNHPFSKNTIWSRTMKDKINVVTAKLQDLIEEKAALGLRVEEEIRSKNRNRKLQTSLVDASSIVGRHSEKEAEFCVRLDIEAKKDIGKGKLEKCRHMSFVREEYVTYKKFQTSKKAKSLRTFLATSVTEVESWQEFHLSNKIH